MIVAIDYDNTYTCDPLSWDEVIETLKKSGHTVYCVTMRYEELHESMEVYAALNGKVDAIFCTGRKAKRDFMEGMGINISVWIDDMPLAILKDFK